jgi:hypothetical protein
LKSLAEELNVGLDSFIFVDDTRVVAFHDRDLVRRGIRFLGRQLSSHTGATFVTVSELGRQQAAGR